MFGRRSSRVGSLVNNGIKTIFFYRFATDVVPLMYPAETIWKPPGVQQVRYQRIPGPAVGSEINFFVRETSVWIDSTVPATSYRGRFVWWIGAKEEDLGGRNQTVHGQMPTRRRR